MCLKLYDSCMWQTGENVSHSLKILLSIKALRCIIWKYFSRNKLIIWLQNVSNRPLSVFAYSECWSQIWYTSSQKYFVEFILRRLSTMIFIFSDISRQKELEISQCVKLSSISLFALYSSRMWTFNRAE